MTKTERVSNAVRERLRIANERLMKRNGVNPTAESYIRKKMIVEYAWKHNMTVQEAEALFRRDAYLDTEKQIGRPLRSETSKKGSGHIKAVQNPITGEAWQSMQALADHLGLTVYRVRYAIEHKVRLVEHFYEYVQ